jgi:hypothetical protein
MLNPFVCSGLLRAQREEPKTQTPATRGRGRRCVDVMASSGVRMVMTSEERGIPPLSALSQTSKRSDLSIGTLGT